MSQSKRARYTLEYKTEAIKSDNPISFVSNALSRFA